MSITKEPGPDTESKFHTDQKDMWKMLRTLLGGTTAMRKAGKDMMPKYEREEDDSYRVRLDRATLLNYFKRTLTGLVGKPFSKPVHVPDSMPDQITELFEDVDRQGNDLTTFARTGFHLGMAKGMSLIMVDYPTAPTDPAAKPRSVVEEKEQGAAPYFVLIDPENVIAAYSEFENGVEVLTHIRLRECSVERLNEWEEVEVERIRVLEPGTWALWRKNKDDKYVKESEGTTTLSYIPIVIWYAERESFMYSRPPLLDLAHKNIEHWQSSSDQRNVLSVARFPILGASGVDPESKLQIGPNSYFAMRDPVAKLYYVEHSGAAIGAGRQDMEDLKTEMAMMGLQLLMPQSGGQTATAKALDGAEVDCGLQSLTLGWENALGEAIEIMADWLGIDLEVEANKKREQIKKDKAASAADAAKNKPAPPIVLDATGKPVPPPPTPPTPEPPTPQDPKPDDEADQGYEGIKLNTDFGLSLSGAQDLPILLAARQAKEISHEAFVEALRRRGILADDFDPDADAKLLDQEKANEPPPISMLPPPAAGPKPAFGKPPKDITAGAKPPVPPPKAA